VDPLRTALLRPASAAYVLAVAATAALGFVLGSPVPVLLAAAATLPASVVTMPMFYVVTGLLGLVPGANPSSSSGSSSGTVDGTVTTHETGTAATWWTVSTHAVGVLAIAAAAAANVLLVRQLRARRRTTAVVAAE
jgi:hypothetical protein